MPLQEELEEQGNGCLNIGESATCFYICYRLWFVCLYEAQS